LQTSSFRQKSAPGLFLGAFVPQTGTKRTLLGYVDGVLSSETTLTSESMSTHVPGARNVLIHGVCVTPDARKRGIANALLAEYQRRLAAAGSYERVLLIAHEEKIGFYERIGFKSRGLSSIAFAGIPWFELEWARTLWTVRWLPRCPTSDPIRTPRSLARPERLPAATRTATLVISGWYI
jgi:GNAT superfamily N-acetyltransferase